jgi:hypothetical protein
MKKTNKIFKMGTRKLSQRNPRRNLKQMMITMTLKETKRTQMDSRLRTSQMTKR